MSATAAILWVPHIACRGSQCLPFHWIKRNRGSQHKNPHTLATILAGISGPAPINRCPVTPPPLMLADESEEEFDKEFDDSEDETGVGVRPAVQGRERGPLSSNETRYEASCDGRYPPCLSRR
jgi:hypothetical protein